jgi:hypothetical protein
MTDKKVLPIVDGNIEIIYKHNKPYGIKDKRGFLFFFTDVNKYSGQEERYRQEIEQQFNLADYLLGALKKA